MYLRRVWRNNTPEICHKCLYIYAVNLGEIVQGVETRQPTANTRQAPNHKHLRRLWIAREQVFNIRLFRDYPLAKHSALFLVKCPEGRIHSPFMTVLDMDQSL